MARECYQTSFVLTVEPWSVIAVFVMRKVWFSEVSCVDKSSKSIEYMGAVILW